MRVAKVGVEEWTYVQANAEIRHQQQGDEISIISIVVGRSYNAKTFIMVGKLNQNALLG